MSDPEHEAGARPAGAAPLKRPLKNAPQARPPRAVLRQLAGSAGMSPLDALRTVATEPTELEEFRPLRESLEWRLAELFWHQAGVIPFIRNDVPYLVNNSGRLSENSAAVVFAALEEAGSRLPARLTLLELGAGAGLHARYFLDALSALCRDAGRDYYDRLTYIVTDRFERTVAEWGRCDLFADHESHVVLAICDARNPARILRPGGEAWSIADAPLVVFCNYLLDVLPSVIARRTETGLEQLYVRTHLARGTALPKSAGVGSLDEARTLAASDRFDKLTRLLPLLPHLEFETDFRPWIPRAGAEQELASKISGNDRVIVNAGALECVEGILDLVGQDGLLLVNDYGPVRVEDVAQHVGVQRFGGSVALGVNFPLLEGALRERGLTVMTPDADDRRRVHTRLIAPQVGNRVSDVFRSRFGLDYDRFRDEPLEEARRHVAAGRSNDAVAAYRVVVERNPGDWQMLGEAAEYVGLQLRDFVAGLELARAALERNPWCSPWLWNILGDCLFYKEKYDEAHEAFLQAERIDADDPRTNLNLAYTLSQQGAHADALAAIARGLAQDGQARGAYRSRLLEKQAQILTTLSEQAAAENERLIKRSARFR